MEIYEHLDPLDDPPTRDEMERFRDNNPPEEFVEWVLERKKKVTRSYFVDRWGLDVVDIKNAIDEMQSSEDVIVHTY